MPKLMNVIGGRGMKGCTVPLAVIAALFAASPAQSQGMSRGDPVPSAMPLGNEAGDPTIRMEPGQTLLSAFGERPVFSPDGRKLAFIGKSYGDAFEVDLATRAVRNLTAHAPSEGWLRIHYLADGSLLLLGPRFTGKTREETRNNAIEMFWMDPAAAGAPVPLGIKVWEGVAVSTRGNRIAWANVTLDPAAKMKAVTTLHTGRVVVANGTASVTDIRTVASPSDCLAEAQDFLSNDTALLMPCYGYADGKATTAVLSVDLASGKLTRYPTPPQLYGEVEGAFPDSRRALVECADDRRTGMDICVLDLDPAKPRYTRMTQIVRYGGWKYGNPVVHPSGRMIAAQVGPAEVVDAGVGHGIVLMQLAGGF